MMNLFKYLKVDFFNLSKILKSSKNYELTIEIKIPKQKSTVLLRSLSEILIILF